MSRLLEPAPPSHLGSVEVGSNSLVSQSSMIPLEPDPEWALIEASLRRAPQLGPAVGFSRRWRVRLEQRRDQRRRRQAQVVLGGLLLGALISLGLLGIEALRVLSSPAGLVADWVRTGLGARSTLEGSFLLLKDVGGGLPAVFGGLAAALTLGWVSVVWFAALYRYSFANLPNGEKK